MPLAPTAPKSRLASAKSRQPIASNSTSSAPPTTASVRSKPTAASKSAPPLAAQPPELLQLPPPLPTINDLQTTLSIKPSQRLIVRRLVSLARSFLTILRDSTALDPSECELDLCSATFFASYAVCLDTSSIAARRTLARCARLGGFNVVLPFAPSGSAASASVSASSLSSQDSHDLAGAQACIHVLQQGSPAIFLDAGSAREYRDACRTLGRPSEAVKAAELLQDKVLGKRRTLDIPVEDPPLPQLVTSQSRYHSQLQTDTAYHAASRDRTDDARTDFLKALEQDPFNWRAWAGLCDTGYGAASADKHFSAATLDRLYSNVVMDVQGACTSMEAALKSLPPFSNEQLQSTVMTRKVSEDGSNKKFKVSSSEGPHVTTLGANAARFGAPSRPTDKVKPSLPSISASTVTATRLHPSSRALSAAQTNTHHLEPLSADHDDVKAAKLTTIGSRPTRTSGVRTATVVNPASAHKGRELRSTAQRHNPTTLPPAGTTARARAAPSRAGATSQAESVSSTSSASSATSTSSRATVSTARTAVSTRRTGTAAPSQISSRAAAAKPASSAALGRSTASATANGTGQPTTKRVPAATSLRPATGASVSRPGSAMSKASSTSNGGVSTSLRANGTLASTRTAAEAMRRKEEDTAKLKLEQLSALRETCLQQLTAVAHQHAADRFVLALLAQVGEAYRLLRLCEGDRAAALLQGPILNDITTSSSNEVATAKEHGHSDDITEGGTVETTMTEDNRFTELQVKDSLLHHLMLGRSYAECSQYASSETHFTAARKHNHFVASHMDVFSLVLFHLSREVKLSALAQHLAMIAPGTASTHIVVGNAFSLQKEHQTALVCFQRAAAAAPGYAYAYTLAGHEAHDLGLYDEAIAYFRSAIRCDRRHWNAWAGLGRVYLGIGEHEHAASKSLQQAIHINPSNHILWDLVGWTFSLINAPAKAAECYDRAIELAPSASVLTYLRRAELLLQHGDAESSHRDLIQAHNLAPEEASIHILLAQSYMRLGGGAFCHLEHADGGAGQGAAKTSAALRATGVMVLPSSFQAEITHHLSVAIDLDPSLLRVVKSICEGYNTLPGSKLSVHPHDLTAASLSHSHMSATSALTGYDQTGGATESYAGEGGESQMQYGSHSYRQANSTPHQHHQPHNVGAAGGLLVPADFAASHPPSGYHHDSSSFLSLTTPAHSATDIVLEDADVST